MTMNKHEYREATCYEWRKGAFYRDLLAEFVGTFMLMTVQSALPLTWDKENMGTVLQVALCMGFVVATMAWTVGDFGGGHFNPAVTFAMMLLGKVTIIRALLYVGIQNAACIGGAAFINAVTPANLTETLAATSLHPDMQPWQGYLVETWITFMLVFTILGATNGLRKKPLYMPPVIIGMAISMGIAVAFNSTGGSMNPARSMGPAVVMTVINGQSGFYDNLWIYWAGPLSGAALAALIYGAALDLVDRPDRDDDDDDDGYNLPKAATYDHSIQTWNGGKGQAMEAYAKNNPAYTIN